MSHRKSDLGIPFLKICQSSASFHRRTAACLIRRTAGYGPVCPVVWEGRRRETPPYPDLLYCLVCLTQSAAQTKSQPIHRRAGWARRGAGVSIAPHPAAAHPRRPWRPARRARVGNLSARPARVSRPYVRANANVMGGKLASGTRPSRAAKMVPKQARLEICIFKDHLDIGTRRSTSCRFWLSALTFGAPGGQSRSRCGK